MQESPTACKSGHTANFIYSHASTGLLINNGHAVGTLRASVRKKRKKERKGVLFALHVGSLGVSGYVGRRAGLFLKCPTLTLREVGGSHGQRPAPGWFLDVCASGSMAMRCSRAVKHQQLHWGLISWGRSICRLALGGGVWSHQVQLAPASHLRAPLGFRLDPSLCLKKKKKKKMTAVNICARGMRAHGNKWCVAVGAC